MEPGQRHMVGCCLLRPDGCVWVSTARVCILAAVAIEICWL